MEDNRFAKNSVQDPKRIGRQISPNRYRSRYLHADPFGICNNLIVFNDLDYQSICNFWILGKPEYVEFFIISKNQHYLT